MTNKETLNLEKVEAISRMRSTNRVSGTDRVVTTVARSPRPRFKCHITNVSPHQEPLNILVISKTFGKTRTKASTRCLNLKSDVFHPTDLT